MSDEEKLAEKLELIADMGEREIETLADTLAEYFRKVAKRNTIGFVATEEQS